jgi:hypothetical protein
VDAPAFALKKFTLSVAIPGDTSAGEVEVVSAGVRATRRWHDFTVVAHSQEVTRFPYVESCNPGGSSFPLSWRTIGLRIACHV